MSYNWAFYSFDYDVFVSHLAERRSNDMISEKDIEEAALHEIDDMYSKDEEKLLYRQILSRVLESGINYSGLNKKEKKMLDEIVHSFMACVDPGYPMEKALKMKPESPNFLSNQITFDILERGAYQDKPGFFARLFNKKKAREYSGDPNFIFLPRFEQGRRWGENENSWCEYVLLSPTEAQGLKAELERELASARPWAEDWQEEHVRECFLHPVNETINKNKGLFARLS